MGLFQPRWLRRLVRRHTAPIGEDAAHMWKRRLSLVYMVLSWQAFGFVCYMMYTGRNDWAKYYGYKSEMDEQIGPARQFAKGMKIENGTIIRISGFQKVGEEEITKQNKSDLETPPQ